MQREMYETLHCSFTFGAVSSTFGLFSISHSPSLKPFRLLGLAYLSLLSWYGNMSFGPRKALPNIDDKQRFNMKWAGDAPVFL